MARGISKDMLIPYVLEEDRGLPEDQQTVFHIKPTTGHEDNIKTSFYLKAIEESGDGKREMDVQQADRADVANFKTVVKKIENYAFPSEYYENSPGLKKNATEVEIKDDFGNEETVLFTKEISLSQDGEIFKEVVKTLPASALREINEVSSKVSKLKEGEKKS